MKRWKLWKKEGFWLPAAKRHITARDTNELLEDGQLGEPYMDVVIRPGDVLYVPRGCFHSTSTPASPLARENLGASEDEISIADSSMHLTVHAVNFTRTPIPA